MVWVIVFSALLKIEILYQINLEKAPLEMKKPSMALIHEWLQRILVASYTLWSWVQNQYHFEVFENMLSNSSFLLESEWQYFPRGYGTVKRRLKVSPSRKILISHMGFRWNLKHCIFSTKNLSLCNYKCSHAIKYITLHGDHKIWVTLSICIAVELHIICMNWICEANFQTLKLSQNFPFSKKRGTPLVVARQKRNKKFSAFPLENCLICYLQVKMRFIKTVGSNF